MSAVTLFPNNQKSSIKLCVIVPVKNEEENLIHTLNALNFQKNENGYGLSKDLYEVLLLTNNCTDGSYNLALEYQKQYADFNLHVADIELAKNVAHIGTVRRMLMDEAYNRFIRNNNAKGIIASTDGDSEVDEAWINNIILAMEKGIDVVGGRILSKNTPNSSRLYHLQNVTYRYYMSKLESVINPCAHDPWPRHFQCYGPSIAVTCDTYNRAGRLPVLPFLEDEEFRKALYRIDAKVRMCPKVKVYTSARLVGKVDFGFSVQLQVWADMKTNNRQIVEETLDALIEKFELKRLLKECWEESLLFHSKKFTLKSIAERLQIDFSWLKEEFKTNKYFGTLWEKVEKKFLEDGGWRKVHPLVPIGEVISAMRNYFYSTQNNRITVEKFRDTA